MVGQVKTVNGVKKIVPLTAEARAGNPVSTIIAIYSNLVPSGYLPCNGVQFDETQFPALYAILGDNHTPDLRECALVGAGQNATDTIATHDVYNVGQFKDDRVQNHNHSIQGSAGNSPLANIANYLWGDSNRFVEGQGSWESQHSWSILQVGELSTGRTGNTTRGKRKGVNYCIKATAGLDESDADYVLGVLAPVDEVTVDNMHSVTSNAVAKALPKILKITKSIPFYSDYSYRVTPSDLGLTTFANAVVQVSATAWENMVDISEQADNHISMRVWAISTTGNATVSLKSGGSVTMLFTVIYYA